jgi:hypothetical protein
MFQTTRHPRRRLVAVLVATWGFYLMSLLANEKGYYQASRSNVDLTGCGIIGAMPFQVEIRHEALNYTGIYVKPALELWGNGGAIIKSLLDNLGPHGTTFQSIQVSNPVPNASDTSVTAQVPQGGGTVKFGFDKLEFKFANFNSQFFEAIPTFMSNLSAWLHKAPDFKFASHHFTYFVHGFVKDSTPQEALRGLVKELKSAGISTGNGAIFNQTVPSKSWETQLLVDKSRHLTGGVFISLELLIKKGEIDYAQVVKEGREYLASALSELNLEIVYA